MKRMIKYPDTKDFASAIRDIKFAAQYTGQQDEEGNPITNQLAVLPTITVKATEKIHGTNAAVCYSNPDGLWVQSRENIITLEKDNAGCAFAVYRDENAWNHLIGQFATDYQIDLDKYIITIYFEWCGGNIQKKSAVSGLDKRAVIFSHFKVSPLILQEEDNEKSFWLSTGLFDYTECNIYNVSNYKTWEFEVDFNYPQLYQNKFLEVIEEVEANSPIGCEMGIENNIGEGIVCEFWYKDSLTRFKVKGEKHANSKVKTLKPVDEEKEKSKIELSNKVCTALRLEQAWQKTFGIGNEIAQPDKALMGEFLRAVSNDILKEEMDKFKEFGLEIKDIGKYVSSISRNWFEEQLLKE